VFGGVEVFGGVFVFGGVAAADVSAGKAEAQMDPTIAHFEALFAAFCFGLYLFDLIEMRALIGHGLLPEAFSALVELECGPEIVCCRGPR
jgi:hypothetical protein